MSLIIVLDTDIAQGMMKKGKVVEALDLAYTFGFEERFSPQTVLNSFLQKSNEVWKKAKQARDVPSLLVCSNWVANLVCSYAS